MLDTGYGKPDIRLSERLDKPAKYCVQQSLYKQSQKLSSAEKGKYEVVKRWLELFITKT